MILIQVILLLAILLIGVYFMKSRGSSKSSAFKKLALIFFVVAAIVAVIFPNLLTSVANVVGVGRGADLLLYGLTMVIIFQLFNNYTKDKQDQRRTVELARKLAILEAQLRLKK